MRLKHAIGAAVLVLLVGCSLPPGPSTGSSSPILVKGEAKLEGVGTHSGITVTLESPGVRLTAETDAEGRYAILAPEPGDYAITLSRPSYFPHMRPLRVGASGAEVEPIRIKNHHLFAPLTHAYDPSRETTAQPMMGPPIPRTRAWTTHLKLSPDGTRLGYVEGGSLKSVALSDRSIRTEAAVELAEGERIEWFDWGQNGFLVQKLAADQSSSLWAVEANGSRLVRKAAIHEVFSPAWSPDGSEIVFVRYDTQLKLPYLSTMKADGSAQRDFFSFESRLKYAWTPTYGFMFAPLEWTQRGILFHAPMTCDINTRDFGGDGIYVLKPDHDPQAVDAVQKAHHYSFYEHTFTTDRQKVLVGSRLTLVAKDLSAPTFFTSTTPIGHFTDDKYTSLVAAPDGKRIFYLTPQGIEEMNLL